MTPDDWWTRLVYEDPTPVADMRMNHMSKLHISTARHLADSHDHRYDAQVPLWDVQADHKALHSPAEMKSHHVCGAVDCTGGWAAAHPHAASR